MTFEVCVFANDFNNNAKIRDYQNTQIIGAF